MYNRILQYEPVYSNENNHYYANSSAVAKMATQCIDREFEFYDFFHS